MENNAFTFVQGKDVDFSKYAYTISELEKFRIEFDKITSFLDKEISQENFQLLANSFLILILSIPLPGFLVDKNWLVRGRANYNGEVFREETDISYNTKAVRKIPPSRFNRPYEAMFYGAIPFGKQAVTVTTVCTECCKEIDDENSRSREHYFTFGKWYLKEPVAVLNLCFNEKCLEVNSALKANVDVFKKELNEKLSVEVESFIHEYWTFLTGLACSKCSTPQQHFISTAFISTMKEYYGDQFNGIIYPSSMTGMEGVNIVLTPMAVDQYLDLKKAFMIKLERTPNNHKSYHSYQASNIADVIDKKFSFTTIW